MRRVVLALAAGLLAHSASASPVTYRFQGQVTSSSGIFSGQGSLEVNGTFAFDTELADINLLVPPPNAYREDAFFSYWPPNGPLTSSFVATLDYGSIHLSWVSVPHPTDAVAALWFLNNFRCGTTCTEDSIVYHLQLPQAANSDRDFYLNFVARETVPGRVPSAIPEGVLDNTTNGARAVLDSLNPASFSFINEGSWVEDDASANGGGALFFTVTQVAPVPLPAAFWLLGSGLVGLLGIARGRRRSA